MSTGNLVLTRKVGERIVINENTILEVVSIDSKEVRLSFNAPKNVTIDREEVHERKRHEADEQA
jgi:carbon storage regulator